MPTPAASSRSLACSQRILEQFEGRCPLPIGVVEVVAGERLAPRLQQASKTAMGDLHRHDGLPPPTKTGEGVGNGGYVVGMMSCWISL
jgi:hypothetical protein